MGVLVTRPSHQSGSLIQQIEALGARAIAFPSIEIVPVQPDLSKFDLHQYQIIIFISVNAVENGLNYIKNVANFAELQICAIGKRTAQFLTDAGLQPVIQPDSGFNSEALLALDIFSADKIGHKNILIVRGEGGREFLADTLKSRGARVDYLEVYQRKMPQVDSTALLADWSNNMINIVTVTSNETLKNLYYMLKDKGLELLLNTPLITPSERCRQLAVELGFRKDILQAASASNDDIITQLKNWLVRNK